MVQTPAPNQRSQDSESHAMVGKGRVLVVPDIHQEVEWVRRLLRQEEGQWDHVVFLGDYFDTYKRPPEAATAVETAEYLLELKREFAGRSTFLLGNHDIPYLEVSRSVSRGLPFRRLVHPCPGFSPSEAETVGRLLGEGFFADCRLFVQALGYLLSHAGVHPTFWRAGLPDITDPIESLEALCAIALEHVDQRRLAILGVGSARGGAQPVGGITWLDWRFEFEDAPALPPQIVGHTPSTQGPRWNGRSICIDGGQSCWLMLHPDGTPEVRYLRDV